MYYRGMPNQNDIKTTRRLQGDGFIVHPGNIFEVDGNIEFTHAEKNFGPRLGLNLSNGHITIVGISADNTANDYPSLLLPLALRTALGSVEWEGNFPKSERPSFVRKFTLKIPDVCDKDIKTANQSLSFIWFQTELVNSGVEIKFKGKLSSPVIGCTDANCCCPQLPSELSGLLLVPWRVIQLSLGNSAVTVAKRKYEQHLDIPEGKSTPVSSAEKPSDEDWRFAAGNSIIQRGRFDFGDYGDVGLISIYFNVDQSKIVISILKERGDRFIEDIRFPALEFTAINLADLHSAILSGQAFDGKLRGNKLGQICPSHSRKYDPRTLEEINITTSNTPSGVDVVMKGILEGRSENLELGKAERERQSFEFHYTLPWEALMVFFKNPFGILVAKQKLSSSD